MYALVELLRYLEIQPKSIGGLHGSIRIVVVLAASADSCGFDLNREMLFLRSVLIPHQPYYSPGGK